MIKVVRADEIGKSFPVTTFEEYRREMIDIEGVTVVAEHEAWIKVKLSYNRQGIVSTLDIADDSPVRHKGDVGTLRMLRWSAAKKSFIRE